MSRRHGASRRRAYGRRQHEVRERRARGSQDDAGWGPWLRGSDLDERHGAVERPTLHEAVHRDPESRHDLRRFDPAFGHGPAAAGDAA